ncbi:MAG: hypothetical protein HZC14_02545 [Candidatus Niyogibacteria bacterium]|nr:hypothetical protein [Candidatus Niyogibacteria bacterium]
MPLYLSACVTVFCFCLGMYYHDFQIDRRMEILFFGLAVSAALIFEWLLHK